MPVGLAPSPTNRQRIEVPNGVIPLNSPFYIERTPFESRCYQELLNPGALIRIQSPKKTGKSSLILRISEDAKNQGYQTAFFNLRDEIECQLLDSLDVFLYWFTRHAIEQLDLNLELNKLKKYWKKKAGVKLGCTGYFEEYILPKLNRPIVLIIDNIDALFQYPDIAIDFLAMLRLWFNYARWHDVWKNLKLVLANSTGVYLDLDLNQSPFNVGKIILLPELSDEQLDNLAKCYQQNLSTQEINQITEMIGGHPYLNQLALASISYDSKSLTEVLENAPTDQGIYADYLKGIWINISKHKELKEGLAEVVQANDIVQLDPTVMCKLEGMGLVKLENGKAKPSCALYQLYFRERLE